MTLQEDFVLARKLLRKSKRPLMFYDTDTDGTTSYLQLKNKFSKIVGYPFRYRDGERLQEFLETLDYDPDLIVVFDVPFLTKEFFEAFKDKKIIWADHHPTNDKKLIKQYDVHHINPLNYSKKENHAASYLAYKVANTKKNLFYAAMGTVADFYLLDTIIDLYKYSKKEFNYLFDMDDETRKELFKFIKAYDPFDRRVKNKRDYWIRYLGYDAGVNRYKSFFGTVHKNKYALSLEAVEIIRKMSPKEFFEGVTSSTEPPFDRYADLMTEYNKIIKRGLKLEEGPLMFFEYRGEYGFTSMLSEEIIHRFDKSKLVFASYKKVGKDYYQMSIRSRGVDIPEVIKKITNGLNGSGGGHKYSGALRIHKSDYPEMKERLFSMKF